MTEFLHQLVANREHIQQDIELHRAWRETLLREVGIVNDPWELAEETNG